MTERDQDEQDWRIDQMVADIANKKADTALKNEQRRWEPWKALSTAFAAGIAVATGLIALATWFVSRMVH